MLLHKLYNYRQLSLVTTNESLCCNSGSFNLLLIADRSEQCYINSSLLPHLSQTIIRSSSLNVVSSLGLSTDNAKIGSRVSAALLTHPPNLSGELCHSPRSFLFQLQDSFSYFIFLHEVSIIYIHFACAIVQIFINTKLSKLQQNGFGKGLDM